MNLFALRLLLAAALLAATDAMACPGCKEAIAGERGFWGNGYNVSIVFMLVMVLSLFGFVAYQLFKIIRRENAATAQDAADVHASNSYWATITLPIVAVIVVGLMISGSTNSSAAPGPKVKPTAYASEETVRAELAKAQGPLLVLFKSDKCSICVEMAPAIDKVEADYAAKLRLLYANPREHKALARDFTIDNLPCSILFVDGKEAGRREGFASDADYRLFLDAHIK